MTTRLIKSTTLEGYYATGDHECFCFDIHKGPAEHAAARDRDEPHLDDEDCRTYPRDLLPEGSLGRRGRWTVTVEFEPYESERN